MSPDDLLALVTANIFAIYYAQNPDKLPRDDDNPTPPTEFAYLELAIRQAQEIIEATSRKPPRPTPRVDLVVADRPE